ncbi:hypothetical protein [Vibrio cholerae]|uniref:hypothetical protein n=1 Tax=Vibrio cholerae TaxID=666 RepID=UPI0011D9A469|nr:hypothetical protein [Vibrio cholerae]TXY59298.1 hypothetical protein FXE89_14455 [Vibrio cholerae]BCN16892.1 hypothetical protein [Vibrio cholerae]BCN17280.1 hypothetical protein [Vibrio cholerae]GHX54702.1 hypothetical protein VCSRO109_2679 [Vibrio cholerae]GHZ08850.1 hypothetical protein VCSRO122_2784 [Vibrio cholerae]
MKKPLILQPKCYFYDLGLDLYNVDVFEMKPLIWLERNHKLVSHIISCIDHDLYSRAVVLYAKKFDIKTVFLMDGIYDYNNAFSNKYTRSLGVDLFYPFLYEKVYCVGRSTAKLFNYLGAETYCYLPRRAQVSFNKDRTLMFDVLIATANTPYFNCSEKERLVHLIKICIDNIIKLNLTYRLRIFDKEIIELLGEDSSVYVNDGTFSEHISSFKILLSTPSTLTETAVNFDIPVALLDYRDTPIFTSAGWRIHQGVNLSETISDMMNGNISRLHYQSLMGKNIINDEFLNDNCLLDDIKNKNINISNENKLFIYESLLRSKFNLNFEYFVRRVYSHLKYNKLFAVFVKIIKNR